MPHQLTCHPAFRCSAVARIEAELAEGEPGALRLRYLMHGDADRIVTSPLAPRARPQRRDELWLHTCCELFVHDRTGNGYREYNFAPNGDWAAYRFTGYRTGMAPLEASAPRITLDRSPALLALTVTLRQLPLAGLHARPLGLACIVETPTGLSYWALAHPADRPDFHDARSFAITRAEHRDSNE